MSLFFDFVGEVIHAEFPEKNQRIIFGKKISDFNRKAYTSSLDRVNLLPVNGFFSGDIGFLDYSKRKFPNHFSYYISFFGVEPEYRGRGYGKKIIELFLDFSKKEGARNIRANVESFREKNILDLFLDLGFRDMGFPIENTKDCYRLIYGF